MKKLLVLIVLLVLVGLTLVKTHPSREAHKEAVMNGTWRRHLPSGMYIVNGRKVPVK